MSNSKSDLLDTTATVLGFLMLFIGLIVYGIVCRGYLISCAWLWFVIPVFHLVPITIAQAVGLSFFVAIFTVVDIEEQYNDTKKETDESFYYAIIKSLVAPWIIFGIVWLVHLFVA
jgi:hypothetical protein